MPIKQAAYGSVFVPNFSPEQSVVPDLGGLFNLRIDPTWPYYRQWKQQSPVIGAQLNFTFANYDDGITEECSPQYAPTDILGRAEGFRTYVGTANRQVSVVFTFLAQGVGANDYYTAINNEVVAPARWLDSLKFPFVDDSGISHAPPPCIITMGQLLILRVILESATIRWMPGWDTQTMLAHVAEVSCTFTAVHTNLGNYQFTGPTRFAGYTPPGGAVVNQADTVDVVGVGGPAFDATFAQNLTQG